MRIVALDPSLTATGVADSAMPEPFTIRTPKALRGMARLHWLQKEVEEATRGADLVVIEGYSYGSKFQAHALGELGGVLKLSLWCWNRPYVVVPPPVRMKIATGKGQAKKEVVLLEASRRLGYQGHSNDEADAMWLLQLALHHYGLPGAITLPTKHLETMTKSRAEWPDREALVAAA